MSRIIVADCSVGGAWVLPDESSPLARRVLDDIVSRRVLLTVPALWWYELANVLKVSVRRGRLSSQTAEQALFLVRDIPMATIGPADQSQSGILSTAIRENLTAYDATYLHLALSIGAELISEVSDLLRLRRKYTFITSVRQY